MKFNFRFPKISGKSDREKISQIQNYLYQLVEELHFTLNAPEQTASQQSTSAVQDTGTQATADFVTACGEARGWVYRKWSSRAYDIFGEFSVTATVAGTAAGGMLLSEQFLIQLPFAVSSAVVSGTASNAAVVFADVLGGCICFRLLCPTDIEVGTSFTVQLMASGRLRKIKIKTKKTEVR